MQPPVFGIDPSLRATGIAFPDGELRTLTTPSCSTLDDKIERHRHIVGRVAALVRIGALVVIEGPAPSFNNASTHELAGLWWGLVVRLAEQGNSVAVVGPSQLKKFATGKGNAPKPDLRMALYQRAGLDVQSDDQVDAYWLRQAGLHLAGDPSAIPLPKAQLQVLEKVSMP